VVHHPAVEVVEADFHQHNVDTFLPYLVEEVAR